MSYDNTLKTPIFLYIGAKNKSHISVTLDFGGERGIRTPGTVLPYTRVPGEHLKPLRHLSVSLMPK